MRRAQLPDGTAVEIEAHGYKRDGKRIEMVAKFSRVHRVEVVVCGEVVVYSSTHRDAVMRTVFAEDVSDRAVRAEAKKWAAEIRAEGFG